MYAETIFTWRMKIRFCFASLAVIRRLSFRVISSSKRRLMWRSIYWEVGRC